MVKGRSSLFSVSEWTQLISLLFRCVSLLAPVVYAQNRSDEVRALQDFASYNLEFIGGIGGDHFEFIGGYWNVWNYTDENACAWIGVTCTSSFTVAELDLSNWGVNIRNLQPLSLLRDLHHLDLSSNNFAFNGRSTLPEDIGTLTGLTWLDVSQNNLVGQIPANISSCKRLRFLFLERNELEGAIPSSLSELKQLQVLFLAHNKLSGPFPPELTELTGLTSVDLSSNSFDGTIPALPNLTKLVLLQLDNNSFTKLEESWFSTVSQSLQVLSVCCNQLEDVLPSNITVRDLQVLNMTGNRLSGHIPRFSRFPDRPEVNALGNRKYNGFAIDLSHNQLTGEIPSELLHTSSSCDSLNLSHNFLTGNVPFDGTFGNCFYILDLSHNNLSGQLPSNVFRYTGFFFLWLGNNQLSGDVVQLLNGTLGPVNNLVELRLEDNLFTGDLSGLVDANYALLSPSKVIDLSNNHLQWNVFEEIPDPITFTFEKLTGRSTGLREFRVAGNNFSGTSLPSTCFNNKSLRHDALQLLDLSDTHLKGEILSKAFDSACFVSLQFLNLSNNDISGFLPDSIVAIPTLEFLDVSNNQLSGQLPVSLSNNTSLNNRRFFEGNNGLCGYPLSLCPQDLRGTGVQWWVLFIIVGGSVLSALGSCLVATWRWRVYQKRHQQDADLIRTLMEREAATIMPLRKLKKATENFAKGAQIGEGGFGIVYIGKLNNGTMVAIKRSKREGSVKDKERFLNEVRILSQVNHRNLVKLLGCCMENKVAVLVFEYIPNGTLREHLSRQIGSDPLTWNQRVSIAVQTADALNYLHSAAPFPIYHRDVKSANILLDDNYNAKVGDFGISKLAPLQATHVSTIAVQGTIGYIDPEYYTSYKLNDKSDVYSFGVVLLELISARHAIDFHRGGEQTSLVYFAIPYIERGDLGDLIDLALMETYNDLVGNGRNSILTLSKLARKCLDMQSKTRPSMNEVLKELQNLWAKLPAASKTLEDSTSNDDDKDFRHHRRISIFTNDSSSFAMDIDSSSIEMSQFSL